jgi:hypothetical protein
VSVPEARLEDFGSGLTPVTQGWFVVNVRDAEWWFSERRGGRCAFESEYGDPPVEFAELGINLSAARRERGGGDLRLDAGVRHGRTVPARATVELGSSAVGVDR